MLFQSNINIHTYLFFPVTCGEDQFKCEKGVVDKFKRIAVGTTGSIFCIDKMHVCDGQDQCNNGTDEFCK